MTNRYLLVFWVTGACNLRCSYCYATDAHCQKNMDFATAKQVLDHFQNQRIKIQFAGGEPLLNLSLIDQICSYVHLQNIDTVFQLQTNGTLLTDEAIYILKKWRISIGVSLDGVPKVNDLTREKGQIVINGIQRLAKEGIMIGLNTVVTKHNVLHLDELIDLAIYLGNVGGIGLDLLRQVGRGSTNYTELQVDSASLIKGYHQLVNRSNEVATLTGIRIQIREIEEAKKRLSSKPGNQLYCYASCGRSLVVLPNGDIYPCGSLLEEAYYMGKTTNIKDYKTVCLTTKEDDKCRKCAYHDYCPKGCPSRTIRNQGEDLDCVLRKESFYLVQNLSQS